MCTILVNRLEDQACPVNVWLGKLTALDMTPLGWLGRKISTQTNKELHFQIYHSWPDDILLKLYYMGRECLRDYAGTKCPCHPAHPRCLIRVFSVRLQNHLILYNILEEQIARIRLCACAGWIWIWAFCACLKTPFRWTWPIVIRTVVVRQGTIF